MCVSCSWLVTSCYVLFVGMDRQQEGPLQFPTKAVVWMDNFGLTEVNTKCSLSACMQERGGILRSRQFQPRTIYSSRRHGRQPRLQRLQLCAVPVRPTPVPRTPFCRCGDACVTGSPTASVPVFRRSCGSSRVQATFDTDNAAWSAATAQSVACRAKLTVTHNCHCTNLWSLTIGGAQTFLAKSHKQNSQNHMGGGLELWRLKLSYSFRNIKQGRHSIKNIQKKRLHHSNLSSGEKNCIML